MRRVHLPEVKPGQAVLPNDEAHHLRDVLRLGESDPVELFDDQGRTADGVILRTTPTEVVVQIGPVRQPPSGLKWTVASAVPKGPRADWMIEKLSELGTAVFVPLATDRSVVLPEGHGKLQRWTRIAAEAAKQSHRPGVMTIHTLTAVETLLTTLTAPAWYLSTEPGTPAIEQAARMLAENHRQNPSPYPLSLTLLIGPEGGWTQRELAMFQNARLTPVSLGTTILRIETAAIAAAVIAAAFVAPALQRPGA